MRVNIADVKAEPGSHKRVPIDVQLDPVDLAGQTVEFPGSFTGEAEIWNAGDRLLVQASLSGEAIMLCSRCLTPVSTELDVAFDEEFVPGTPEAQQTDEDEEEAEVRTVSYYEGDEIDLADSLRENVLLELPMKLLCSEDCAGLCHTCGANLNEGACKCEGEPTVVDPRLASLKDLLRKPDSNS